MQLNVNTNAVVAYTRQLESIRRSALPTAVRNTLNSAAFDVKKNTMPKSAKKSFIQRKPNFFKAKSKVEMAKGGNIQQMKATVGFVGSDPAIQELKQQEHGGNISGRAFVTNKEARTTKSWTKSVQARNRMTAMDNVINAHKVRIMSKNESTGRMNRQRARKQQFVKAAIMAKKLRPDNALVLGNMVGGAQTLSRIDKITFNTRRRTLKIKRTPLYSYRKGRKVKIKSTNFMQRASRESGLSLEKWFVAHAKAAIKSAK